MTPFSLWLCLLIPGAWIGWIGWMGFASWKTVLDFAMGSGIFAALLALFGEEA